ncbi:MAG TPA: thioesterase family protein [Prolixibacteraceae bacterium]|nr:thioesterase family protein [Prolixibacteraceae bacterium]
MENKATYKNTLPIQIRFSDVDAMGHVSNTMYQNYYDSGKLHYFDEVIPEMDFKTLGVVGASIKIEYLKPVFLRTKILVETRVSHIGNKSMTMDHNLIDETTNEVLSTCKAVLVCYSIQEQSSIPIPEKWKQNILAYDKDVIVKTK